MRYLENPRLTYLHSTPLYHFATHEAGHAVVAHALDLQVVDLSLAKSGARPRKGICSVAYDDNTDDEHYAAALLAGDLAEVKMFGKVTPGDSREDYEAVERLYLTKLAYRHASSLAWRIICARQQDIHRVATVLAMAQYLGGDRLQKVLTDA